MNGNLPIGALDVSDTDKLGASDLFNVVLKVLVEELDYLPDEVDDMDPQIAAVVIEKSLPRPRAGMPIVWRRSIRHKGSTPNPVFALSKVFRGAVGAVLKGVANVLAFPFNVVNGGQPIVSLVVALAAMLTLVTASAQDSSGDREGASPGSSGFQLLEDKLGVAKAFLWRARRRAGEREVVVEKEEKEDTKQGSRWRVGGGGGWRARGGGKGGEGETQNRAGDGELASVLYGAGSNKYFGKGIEGGGDSTASRTTSRGADSSSSSTNRERKFREISDAAPRTFTDNESSDSNKYNNDSSRGEDQGQEDTRVVHHERGGNAAIGKSDPRIENPVGNDLGNGMGGLATGDGGARRVVGDASRELNAKMAVPGAGGMGGVGGVGVERRRKNQQGRRDGGGRQRGQAGYAGREEDHDEACPDAPAGPSTGSAVVFEELPPVMPAPSTIGVLDEDEEVGGMEDDRPRWGRKPMSEHIPDEEEMELWDSKIESSDTWLDRGINRVMSSVFGGGKGDSSSG
eukprot:jgi/Undpi1/12998/HiC_scaffold_7.g02662.m1